MLGTLLRVASASVPLLLRTGPTRQLVIALRGPGDELAWSLRQRALPLPQRRKQALLRQFAVTAGARTFVETGTYLGETTAAMRSVVDRVISIEVSERLAAWAARRFAADPGVSIIHGDSASVLPQLLPQLSGSVLFWLDGHCSGGVTDAGAEYSPVLAEINTILTSAVERPLIVIDDARLFLGDGDYPTVAEVEALAARLAPGSVVSVANDMIAITPGR